MNIPNGYSTSQVAKRLGVSRHEISRLIRTGALSATKVDSGMYVLDAESVHQYELTSRKRGRPWEPDTAWAALLLLDDQSGEDAGTEIGYFRERRLKLKLAEITAEDLVALSRKRARSARYYCSPSFTADLEQNISLSGISSPYLSLLGLTSVPDTSGSEIDGYTFSPIKKTVKECYLVPDAKGNCILREPCSVPKKLKELDALPPIVVAADLANSVNERERRCGLDYLERKLHEYRQG